MTYRAFTYRKAVFTPSTAANTAPTNKAIGSTLIGAPKPQGDTAHSSGLPNHNFYEGQQ